MTGLKKSGVAGLTVSALGGGLMYRGLTGHCAVYDAMQVNTTSEPSKGLHVVKAVTINKEPAELYRVLAQLREPAPVYEAPGRSQRPGRLPFALGGEGAGRARRVEWDAEIINERRT